MIDIESFKRSIVLISDRRRFLEILAVFLTATGKFIFMDILNWRFLFIASAITSWTVYILLRNKRKKGILKYWGFNSDNFYEVFLMILPFFLMAIISCFVIGYFLGTLNITWHIIPIFIIYPIWGIIQQFLVLGLVAGNLKDQKAIRLKNIHIISSTAILFALIHYPNTWLVIGTFVLALFYCYIFLKVRNVYVLGLFHGWLGTIFYYTIVNTDPFLNVFGKYM